MHLDHASSSADTPAVPSSNTNTDAHDGNSSYVELIENNCAHPLQRKRRRLTNRRLQINPGTTTPTLLPECRCAYTHDFKGAWWNAQALFAADASLQARKQRHAWSLLDKADFVGFSETHGSVGSAIAASLPATARFFWSHNPTRTQAGIALAVKHSFLEKFNPVTDSD